MRIVRRLLIYSAAAAFFPALASAQTAQTLDLQQAEQIAIQNHPQIQVATALASAADAQRREVLGLLLSDRYRSHLGRGSQRYEPYRRRSSDP